MESLDHNGGQEQLDELSRLIPYSTGQLTAAQAAAVDSWRARLQEDKPLPGYRHKGEMLRTFYNLDDRPPCSLVRRHRRGGHRAPSAQTTGSTRR